MLYAFNAPDTTDLRPELRQDLTTGEWAIIAPQRAQRPLHYAIPPVLSAARPVFEPGCDFCPGQEARLPLPISTMTIPDAPQQWLIRVVPNKFPAVLPLPQGCAHGPDPVFPTVAGVGHHEVVIDSPRHNDTLATLTLAHLALLVRTWRDRYRTLSTEPQAQQVMIFKNHGARAGASLPHPHTQILTTPIVASAVQNRYTRARHYLETQRQCLFCTLLQAELAAGTRIVLEHTSYVAYQPYAAFFPYETWIVPRDHQACFGSASDSAITHLAYILHDVVRRLVQVLQDPDYNLIVRTALTETQEPAYHWHLQLIPRLFSLAGFELGSGMAINAVHPEAAAAALRSVE